MAAMVALPNRRERGVLRLHSTPPGFSIVALHGADRMPVAPDDCRTEHGVVSLLLAGEPSRPY